MGWLRHEGPVMDMVPRSVCKKAGPWCHSGRSTKRQEIKGTVFMVLCYVHRLIRITHSD